MEQFAVSKDEVLAYRRLMLTWTSDGETPPPPSPRKTNRKAWLIPASYFPFDDTLPPNDRGGGGGSTPPQPTNNGGGSTELLPNLPVSTSFYSLTVEGSNLDGASVSAVEKVTSTVLPKDLLDQNKKKSEAPLKNEVASEKSKTELRDENGRTVKERLQSIVTYSVEPSTSFGRETVENGRSQENDNEAEILEVASWLREALAQDSRKMLADIRSLLPNTWMLNAAAKRLTPDEHATILQWVLEANSPAATEKVQNREPVPVPVTELGGFELGAKVESRDGFVGVLISPQTDSFGRDGWIVRGKDWWWELEEQTRYYWKNELELKSPAPTPEMPVQVVAAPEAEILELGGFKLGALVALCDPYTVAYNYHGTVEGFRHQREILVRWPEREGKPIPQAEWYEVKELRLI